MAWGFVRSGVTASSPSSPHPVLSNVLCLLILLIIVVSPISAVAYHDRQESDGGVAAAAAGEIDNIPSDLMDLSCGSSGPPRHHRAVLRGQQPAGDDEQESKLLPPPPAEQGRAISSPPSSSVQAEGSEGQDNCQYQLIIRTSCSSLPLEANQEPTIKIWFGDERSQPIVASAKRTGTDFAPCSVKRLTVRGQCTWRVCRVRMTYQGQFGEWTPNFVKVFVGESMYTICWDNTPVSWNGHTVNQCIAAAIAPARTDDEYYNSCG